MVTTLVYNRTSEPMAFMTRDGVSTFPVASLLNKHNKQRCSSFTIVVFKINCLSQLNEKIFVLLVKGEHRCLHLLMGAKERSSGEN